MLPGSGIVKWSTSQELPRGVLQNGVGSIAIEVRLCVNNAYLRATKRPSPLRQAHQVKLFDTKPGTIPIPARQAERDLMPSVKLQL